MTALAGRTVLITGSARGLGLEMARGLCAAGARVLLNGRDAVRLDEAVAGLRAEGGDADALVFDVTDVGAATDALARAGHVDVLVNNVGLRMRRPLDEVSTADLVSMLDSDLVSAFTLSKLASARMVAQGTGGRIINISSIAGQLGRAGDVAYVTAKAGLEGMTRALAAELGPHGITVNAVAPGPIATETNAALASDPRWIEFIGLRTMLGRWGRPEEIAGVVVFLAGDGASFLTGQTIAVDGGMTTQF